MANVALWGSQIKDLDNTVKSLKQQQETLNTFTQTLGKNLTTVEVRLNYAFALIIFLQCKLLGINSVQEVSQS